MTLRDFYCVKCGTVARDVCTDSLTPKSVKRPCYCCGMAITKHRPILGGLKSRWRFMDSMQSNNG